MALAHINNIFQSTPQSFEAMALEQYAFQHQNNHVYQLWCGLTKPNTPVKSLLQIPALPVQFFKTHKVQSGDFEPEKIFTSSGTTGMVNSSHYVKNLSFYEASFIKGFELFYGSISDWCILALLPAYLERAGSSLVYMADKLIGESKHPKSGFYLYDHAALDATLKSLEANHQKTILLGVTFALLDFIEAFPQQLNHTIIMETGGMKGRGEELTKEALHKRLQNGFGVDAIHAEYGMTELLSQAYSFGNGLYKPVPWMKVLVRNEEDPFDVRETGQGLLQIIDLANIDSCSFIATQDIGRVYADGSFEVLGRMDHADLRGCSLLVV